MKNALVGNNGTSGLNVVMIAPSIVEIIAEGMMTRRTTGSVLHAIMSIFLGEQNATVAAKAKTGTSKPTNHLSETTTDQTTVESVLNRNVTDATIGFAHPVAMTISHSVRNATNVENRKQEVAVKDGLVEVFQIVNGEVEGIQIDVLEAVMVDVGSVGIAEDVIQTDAEEIVMGDVDSVETEEDGIQTGAVETVTKDVVLAAAEVVVMTAVTLDEVVKTVIVTMNDQMNAIGKPEVSDRAMHTTAALNPYDLDAIKAKIKTIEVN